MARPSGYPLLFSLIVACGLLLAGCASTGSGGADSGSGSADQSRAKAESLMDSAMADLDSLDAKMDEAEAAFDAGDFGEASLRLNESRQYSVSASAKTREACMLLEQTGEAGDCGSIVEMMDACITPMIDLTSALYALGQDIEKECTLTVCPAGVLQRCSGLLANATALDVNCDTQTAGSVSDLCAGLGPAG